MSPPPAKKFRGRASAVQGMQVIECRREFDLPRQYPSMVTASQNIVPWKHNNTNGTTNGLKISPVPTKEPQVLNQVKKLRIKLQDGRDLGELNVQILSPGSGHLNSKTITVSTSNLLNNLNKPVALSLLPMDKSDGTYKMLSMNSSGNINKESKKFIHVPSILNKKNRTTDEPEIHKRGAVYNTVSGNGHKKAISSIAELQIIKPGNSNTPKYVSLLSGKPLKTKNSKNNGDIMVNTKKDDTEFEKSQYNKLVVVSTSKEQHPSYNKQSCSKSLQHWKLAESKFPVVKCEKLKLSKISPSKLTNNCERNLNSGLSSMTQRKERKQSFSGMNKEECIEELDIIETVSSSLAHKGNRTGKSQYHERYNGNKVSQNTSNTLNETGSVPPKRNCTDSQTAAPSQSKLAQNVMVAVHDTNAIHENNHNNKMEKDVATIITRKALAVTCKKGIRLGLPMNEKESTVMPRNEIDPAVTSTSNKTMHNEKSKSVAMFDSESCFSRRSEHKDITSQIGNEHCASTEAPLNDSSDIEKLSEHWSIITKAVSSVKDDELRARALKALADCGIGIERHVSITPPEKLKAVHDAMIQTEVFSLLDPQNFILVRENLPKVERISETERVLSNPVIVNAFPLEPVKQKQNTLMTIDNTFLGPATFPSFAEEPLNFDSFFEELCNENSGAHKVKEVLSAPSPMCTKILTQLERDFKYIKQRDESGMLNIHRAVVDNNEASVKRLIMVLKACNESIDVLTEDGMTSLELAVQANTSVAIVKQLLEAGAEPVQSKLVHESALILASKMSSPLLSELVQYVADPSLFDQVDSEGFAPLHYCAIYGNIEGIEVLVQAGAEVNLRDSRSGRTPFFHAVENNHTSVAHKLLLLGALTNLPNFAGQTVLTLVDDIKSLSLRTALNKIMK